MKILIDENLSHRLANRLSDLLPEMHHVRDLQCKAASHTELWKFAISEGYAAILTADIDFQNKVIELGAPPRVIRIERCNFSFREICDLLRSEAVRITEFLQSPQPLLVLRR